MAVLKDDSMKVHYIGSYQMHPDRQMFRKPVDLWIYTGADSLPGGRKKLCDVVDVLLTKKILFKLLANVKLVIRN